MRLFNVFKSKNKNNYKLSKDELNLLASIVKILDTEEEASLDIERNILSKNSYDDESKIFISNQKLYCRDEKNTFIYPSVFMRANNSLKIESDMSNEDNKKAISFIRNWQDKCYQLWAEKFKEASIALVTAIDQVQNDKNKTSIVKDLQELIDYIIIETLNSIEETDLELKIKTSDNPKVEEEIAKTSSKLAAEAIRAHKEEKRGSHD